MLAIKRTKVLDEIPNLDDDPRVEAEHEKLEHLTRRRDQIEIDLEAARGQSPHQRVRDEAAALIAGQPAPSKDDKPVRADLIHAQSVVEEAIKIQTARIETVKRECAREARVQLTPRRAELLARIDSAAENMIGTVSEYLRFCEGTDRFDISQGGGGHPWAPAPIGLGGPRALINQLEAWRTEYAANKFVVKG